MAGVKKGGQPRRNRSAVESIAAEEWTYPTGMVWCPMKMSGMAVMKCAELQKRLGCGSLKVFKSLATARPAGAAFFWPWLRRGRECPARANEQEVRELRLALSPLKPVDKSRKNPRAYVCPQCGGGKSFGARRCRACWRGTAKGGWIVRSRLEWFNQGPRRRRPGKDFHHRGAEGTEGSAAWE